MCCTSIAMFGHEGSHRSFSRSPARNALLVYLTFPLFSGLGALYWRDKHDRRHHAHPNVEGLDPDHQAVSVRVVARRVTTRAGRGERWFQRVFQRWLFWPMADADGDRDAAIVDPVPRALRRKRDARVVDRGRVPADALRGVARRARARLGAARRDRGLLGDLGGRRACASRSCSRPRTWACRSSPRRTTTGSHQLETTRDLELPRAISFFFIGLDYQVEHHLFPKIPHQRTCRARRRSRARGAGATAVHHHRRAVPRPRSRAPCASCEMRGRSTPSPRTTLEHRWTMRMLPARSNPV